MQRMALCHASEGGFKVGLSRSFMLKGIQGLIKIGVDRGVKTRHPNKLSSALLRVQLLANHEDTILLIANHLDLLLSADLALYSEAGGVRSFDHRLEEPRFKEHIPVEVDKISIQELLPHTPKRVGGVGFKEVVVDSEAEFHLGIVKFSVLDDLFTAIAQHQADLFDPLTEQSLHLVIKDGLSSQLQETLGAIFGHGKEPSRDSSDQDNGFHFLDPLLRRPS